MGEQGAESIHAHIMHLEQTHQGIANDVDRLHYIMKEHMLESAPSLTYPSDHHLENEGKRREKAGKAALKVKRRIKKLSTI